MFVVSLYADIYIYIYMDIYTFIISNSYINILSISKKIYVNLFLILF